MRTWRNERRKMKERDTKEEEEEEEEKDKVGLKGEEERKGE